MKGKEVENTEKEGSLEGTVLEEKGKKEVCEVAVGKEEEVDTSGLAKEVREELLFDVVKEDPWTGEWVTFRLPREAAEREGWSRKAHTHTQTLLGRD